MTSNDGKQPEHPIFTTEILLTMVTFDAHIEVLRGPTGELISICSPDAKAMFGGFMPREMLYDLVEANLVRQDGVENERKVTVFRLTEDGRARR